MASLRIYTFVPFYMLLRFFLEFSIGRGDDDDVVATTSIRHWEPCCHYLGVHNILRRRGRINLLKRQGFSRRLQTSEMMCYT